MREKQFPSFGAPKSASKSSTPYKPTGSGYVPPSPASLHLSSGTPLAIPPLFIPTYDNESADVGAGIGAVPYGVPAHSYQDPTFTEMVTVIKI